MYSDLILLTKHFPFNDGRTPGETFLESEISVLSEQAERVFVFAADAREGAVQTVALPENVTAVPLQRKKAATVSAISAGTGIRFFFSAPPEIREEAGGKSVREKLFLFYFASRAEQKLRRIQKWISRSGVVFGPDILIYSYWFYDFARTAVLLKKDLGSGTKHCISRAHRYDLYAYVHRLRYLPLRPWLIENLDHIFPCSRDGTQYLASRYGNPGGKIETVYVGTRDYGIQKWERRTNRCMISCSRIVPVKRVHRIIDALALLEERGISLTWVHIGGGETLECLRKECGKRLSLSRAVFLGNRPNREVLAYYAGHVVDFFINVSENEGLPAAIMEAASFGIPAVATDVGGTSELVADGVNGYLLNPRFTDGELADTIQKILALPDENYRKMRQNAREIWEDRFQARKNSLRMLEEAGKNV